MIFDYEALNLRARGDACEVFSYNIAQQDYSQCKHIYELFLFQKRENLPGRTFP
jgi:hypothetical protein